MSQLFVLFEHAAGYSLFSVSEFEELSVLTQEVEQCLHDASKFRQLVQLLAFQPFKTGQDALDNINSVSEGILHPDLQLFLETNLPMSKKKKKRQLIVLGVLEPRLAVAITEALGFTCQSGEVIPEIVRGIREHFHHLVTGLTEEISSKAQLALALNYSRSKVQFNINRVDNMVIQSIALLDQMDKDLNTFTMRIREWYSYHFPELKKLVPENTFYAQAVSIIRDRNNMAEDVAEKLEELLMSSERVQVILNVAKSSIGMEICEADLVNIESFCTRVTSLIKYRHSLMEYLKEKMHNIAPNLAGLIGETVGARLISHAGSLTNLAKYPASTVQILGAEKALFRALKTRGNTPKYGLIFHSTFIGRAAKENKGRISRYLANKCAMASRIDCFSEVLTDVFGKKLKQQVEDRLKFYDTGDLPGKNVDIMAKAAEEATVEQERLLKKKRKREKKQLKLEKAALEESLLANSTSELPEDDDLVKSEFDASAISIDGDLVNGVTPTKKKKKKKKKSLSEDPAEVECENHVMDDDEDEMSSPMKKKRKLHHNADVDEQPVMEGTIDSPVGKKKKKKKSKNQNDESANEIVA